MTTVHDEIVRFRWRFAEGDRTAESQFYAQYQPALGPVIRRLLRGHRAVTKLDRLLLPLLGELSTTPDLAHRTGVADDLARRFLRHVLEQPMEESSFQTLDSLGPTICDG